MCGKFWDSYPQREECPKSHTFAENSLGFKFPTARRKEAQKLENLRAASAALFLCKFFCQISWKEIKYMI